ncbi:zinc metalloprotease [Bailinhaonella thermotolerans]|uniref:zinc metalloprotease n=1 Tax=Bailinhaonella thermotolerans TaxID=1070861 RepID=UPI001F5B82BC|nr:zinc metalloprotease [Bailinhaonella thermotolerans]
MTAATFAFAAALGCLTVPSSRTATAAGPARDTCEPAAAHLAGGAREPYGAGHAAHGFGRGAHHAELEARAGRAREPYAGAARMARPEGREPYQPGPRDLAEMDERLRRAPGARMARQELVVPVRVHVITDGRKGATDADVKRQIAVLNDAYGGRKGGVDTGVRFRLAGVDRKVNAEWFRDPLNNEQAMKTALRRGGPETLNLYIAQLSRLMLGYSTYPHWYEREPRLDGVVIDWRTTPGGSLKDFDHGYTGVHEIGHWLGLLHTFENGCHGRGDRVADTPPEATPTEGCPKFKDTCKAPGADPIHNFMDYAHDRCMREFTRGQADRMRAVWRAYRVAGSPPQEQMRKPGLLPGTGL